MEGSLENYPERAIFAPLFSPIGPRLARDTLSKSSVAITVC